jgi:hypothetical protein
MFEILAQLPRVRAKQESQDRKRQQLAGAIGNLRFLQSHILPDQQVISALEANASGVIVLSSGDSPLIIANRGRVYEGIEFYPTRSSAQKGPLGVFIDLSKFGRFIEIDEIHLRSTQDDRFLPDIFHSNIVQLFCGLQRVEIDKKVRKIVEEASKQTQFSQKGLVTA